MRYEWLFGYALTCMTTATNALTSIMQKVVDEWSTKLK
jgi:hypothetical protein